MGSDLQGCIIEKYSNSAGLTRPENILKNRGVK